MYAQQDIEQLQREWRGSLRFEQVLSHEPDDSGWQGPRGLVTDHINKYDLNWNQAQAYLCGPPGMIDAAINRFKELGLSADHIHFDKFE
ncbi:MAG: hypothetical protein R3194_01355 [Limnobacter sp.]|nr:hypothetical protein [Limnobacter sp.]